jgi:hypothetical protein
LHFSNWAFGSVSYTNSVVKARKWGTGLCTRRTLLITLLWSCYIDERSRFLGCTDNSVVEKGLPNGLNRVTLLTAVPSLIVGTNGVGIHRVVASDVLTVDAEAVAADH